MNEPIAESNLVKSAVGKGIFNLDAGLTGDSLFEVKSRRANLMSVRV